MPTSIKQCDQIPVQPLLDYIEKLGGVASLPGFGVWVGIERTEENPSAGEGYRNQRVHRTDEERRRLDALRRRLAEAETRGWIPLFTADAICCDYLNLHPMQVYGLEWFGYGAQIDQKEERWVERWAHEDTYADRRMGMAA